MGLGFLLWVVCGISVPLGFCGWLFLFLFFVFFLYTFCVLRSTLLFLMRFA
jgi:hypothetical protein